MRGAPINLVRRRDGEALGIAVGSLLAIRDAEARGDHDQARAVLDELLRAAGELSDHWDADTQPNATEPAPTTSGDDRP